MWHRIQENLAGQQNPSWSYVTRVRSELSAQATQLDKRLESETKNIRDYLQPVVMFGIFLLAVTILGVSVSVILSVRDTRHCHSPKLGNELGMDSLAGRR